MSNRKRQTFDEYRYGPRSVLKPGDVFRVGGGPVYITNDGAQPQGCRRGRRVRLQQARWAQSQRAFYRGQGEKSERSDDVA